MNWNSKKRGLEARFSPTCSADNDAAPASDAGTGGGGTGSQEGGQSSPALPASGGGQVQQNADHSGFNSVPSTPAHADRVRTILDTGKANKEHTLSMDDIADLIRFDAPFNPPAVAATTVPLQPNAATVPPAPTPAQPAATVPPISPDAAAIIAALRAQLPASTSPTPAPATEPARPTVYYGGEVPALQVSAQILQGLLGTDDPAILSQSAPAVNTLINGIMNRVLEDANLRMQSLAAAMLNQVPRQIEQVNTIASTEQKFYSKFAELQKPAFKATVDTISGLYVQAKRRQDPNFQWTDATFAECGELIHRKLEKDMGFKIPRGTVARIAAAPAQPNANVTPIGPYVSRGSARPPAADVTKNQSADLLSFVI